MKVVNIQAAKTHLSRLVEEAAKGEAIVLAKAGRPMVRLVPVTVFHSVRQGGQLRGQIWESDDCWSTPEDSLEQSISQSLYPLPSTPFPTDQPRVAEDPS